jgi:hypothetical protein
MVACLFHATHLKEVKNPNFFGLFTSSLCMDGITNLELQVMSKKLSGNQDLSLFENFVVFLPSTPLNSHVTSSLLFTFFFLFSFNMVFSLCFA